jgi:hypothetical protein
MSDKFTCPRRIAEGRTIEGRFGGDGEGKDEWRKEQDGLHTCSYDGSLHPDEFMRLVREGSLIGTTDKGYKFYVREADKSVKGAGKFYTHHLSEEQSEEFFRLWCQGSINFGDYPPYVRLYLPGLTTEKATAIHGEVNG